MKKVLIITYYWPPSGGAGVQRWLKFTKYLPEFGWQPIIYTPENPDFSTKDESLLKEIPKETEVIKTKIWEPYNLHKTFSGKQSDSANAGFFAGGKKSWKQKVSIFIRGNFFIPDPRVFWVKPSIKYLKKYLLENPVDAIVSTGPPHSMHLIALGLRKHFPNIKWIADFRDPWTEIDFYHDLQLTSWADKKHKRLEHEVLKNADEVVVVGNQMATQFLKINSNVSVIYNGYDEDDFSNLRKKNNEAIDIVYIGSMNKDRHYKEFWQALSKLIEEDRELLNKLKVKIIGNVDGSIKDYISSLAIDERAEFINYMPHKDAIEEMQNARLLYLPINNVPSAKFILTGKLFEYLAVKKPILCIGPKDGDAAIIIKETNSGVVFERSEQKELHEWLKNLLSSKQHNFTFTNTEKFSRKELTKELVKILQKKNNLH
ncbi:MAG: glycosyltransferase family 4 protein [Bacteroidia bacterium]